MRYAVPNNATNERTKGTHEQRRVRNALRRVSHTHQRADQDADQRPESLCHHALLSVPALASYAESLALALVVVFISYLSLIIGELVPKRLALQSAEGIAIRLAPFLRFLGRLTGPIVRFLTASTELVLRLLGRHNVEETRITEDDVMALVREGTAEGTLEAAEADLISSVFTFTDRTVRSLMTPRTRVVAVEVHRPFAEVVDVVIESPYSRIPIYNQTLGRIIGVVHARDVLKPTGGAAHGRARARLTRGQGVGPPLARHQLRAAHAVRRADGAARRRQPRASATKD